MKKLLTIFLVVLSTTWIMAGDKVAEQIMQGYEDGSAKKEDTLAKLKMRKDALAKAGKAEEAKEVEEMIESMADEGDDQAGKPSGTQSKSKNDYLIVDLKSRKLTYSATPPPDLLKNDKYKTDKLVMRRIPAGTFMMGETGKQHKVTLTKDFYIGVFEVTQGQWENMMKANPSEFKDVGKDAPVEQVSWEDCQNFMKELNGRKSSSLAFRLPTESEWEYACRGGDKKTSKGFKYSGSGTLDEVAWFKDNSGGKTHPVGKKKANELGLYDMSGNVWEWCSDWFGEYSKEPEKDTVGAKSGTVRILRGGGWDCDAGYCRSALRLDRAPTHRGHNVGFRLVLPAQ